MYEFNTMDNWRTKRNELAQTDSGWLIEKPEFRIAVLIPENSGIYSIVSDECKRILKLDDECKFIVEKFVAGGTAEYLLDRYIDLILGKEKPYHAILTIGLSSTLAAKRGTQKQKNKTPIVFSAVTAPTARNLIHSYKESRNNLIGVAVAPPCQLIPIQLLKLLDPKAKSFFVPYREDSVDGQILDDMQKAQKHFALRGMKITFYPFSGKRLAQDLFDKMSEYDAVVAPEAGVTAHDRDAIIEYCKKANIPVHADGAEAIKKGAVFAVMSDIKYVAKKTAHMLSRVTKDGYKPSNLPCSELVKSRRLLFNANSSGVTFSEEYKMMLETCTKNNVPLPRQLEDEKLLLAYCEDNSLGLQEAMRALTKQIEEQVDYITNEPVSTDSDVIDMSQVAAQKPAEPKPFKQRQEEKKKKIESDINKIIHKGFVQSLYIAGPQAIQAAAQRMEEIDRHRPLSAIQFAQSLEEAVGLDIQMPPGNTVHATIMQPPRAETIAHYLKEYMGSDLRSAYFLIGHDALQDESYISSFSVQAKMLNFRVNPIIVENEFDIQRAMEKHHNWYNAFFSVTHLISPSLMEGMVFYGNEFKTMTLAPSLQLGKEAPLSLGLNPQAFSEEVSPFQQLSPVLYARVIPADILYLHGANATRLAAMGYQKAHERVLRRAHKIVLTG